MNTRTHWLKGIALVALSTGFAAAAEEALPQVSDPVTTPQQEIGAELSAGIRETLNGVTPMITLPAIEVQPPTPVAIGG